MPSDKVSTSALAKLGEIPVQQLFSVLKDYTWIRKTDDGWALTAKGEFEGGSYVNSKRYGRYIVWPTSLLDHPLFQAIDSNKLLSAAALGRAEGFSGREINRMLVEIAWLKPSSRGWELTAQGVKEGGQVFESQQSSLSYVLWPEDIRHRPGFKDIVSACRGDEVDVGGVFANSGNELLSIDGKACKNRAHWSLAQWLYLAGIRYAMYRPLPVGECLISDFYLPDSGVYIEYWDAEDHSDAISARMRRAELCKKLGFSVLDVHPEDIANIDDYLNRHLQNLGVDFF